QNRDVVSAKLCTSRVLDEFLECAASARQCDEGVGAVERGSFALVHIAGDDQLLTEPPRPLALGEKVGNDSGCLAAMRQHSVGEYAHQADRTAAIDEPHAAFGENPAELTRRLAESGLGPCTRSAIDTDRID